MVKSKEKTSEASSRVCVQCCTQEDTLYCTAAECYLVSALDGVKLKKPSLHQCNSLHTLKVQVATGEISLNKIKVALQCCRPR